MVFEEVAFMVYAKIQVRTYYLFLPLNIVLTVPYNSVTFTDLTARSQSNDQNMCPFFSCSYFFTNPIIWNSR